MTYAVAEGTKVLICDEIGPYSWLEMGRPVTSVCVSAGGGVATTADGRHHKIFIKGDSIWYESM